MEVTVRLAPETVLPFGLKSLSRYAAALDERFPEVEQLEQIHSGLVPRAFELGFGRLIGAVFADKQRTISLTVQRDLLLLSWTLGKTDYPHFPALKDSLQWALERLRAAASAEFPNFIAANMSYANYISTSAQPTGKDLLTYIRPEYTCPFLTDVGVIHEQNVAWQDARGLSLRLHVWATGGDGEQVGPNGFYIKTVTGRGFEPSAWPDEQLEANHDALLQLFPTLITQEAAEAWGMKRT